MDVRVRTCGELRRFRRVRILHLYRYWQSRLTNARHLYYPQYSFVDVTELGQSNSAAMIIRDRKEIEPIYKSHNHKMNCIIRFPIWYPFRNFYPFNIYIFNIRFHFNHFYLNFFKYLIQMSILERQKLQTFGE